MTPRRRTHPAARPKATAPLLKAPLRLDLQRPGDLVDELRRLHERHGGADSMPDAGELYGVLLWAERNAHRLDRAPESERQQAALHRVTLWQHLREQIDRRQAAAVDAAREAGAQWTALADPLAVNGPSAAYNKAARLRAATLTDPDGQPVRRTPEALADAEARIARRQLEDRRRAQAADELHHVLTAVATRLLAHQDALPTADEDVAYWLEELATELEDGTPAGLHRCLGAAVRALHRHARGSGQPLAATTDALAAVAAAEALPEPA
ncbi:hypothetical protein [Kitasatospora arboriphila]|uniref:Uncharacterized protein n=1 Tax=Kitasatospora arboriphila TaxID=258052 RepID=A0ABP4ETK0_9ACTN